MNAAREAGDYATEVFLHKLIEEQVDSIDEWDKRVDEVATYSSFKGLIWHFDKMQS
jgi:ferritin